MVAAPLGISFFTFLAISYLADVRRGTIPAERSFGCLLLYFTFFPKAAQGPLMRYDGLAPQLAQRRADLPTGIERFILGLGKKVLLAEAAGKIASQVFVLSAVALTPGKMWLGAICYALQIFFDFAGYTDMALGLGRMFGFALPENFNYPYLADSVTDFWRRWHMTLSQWFRDYVYIPLGGNRRGKARQILNLCIVWLLTGLWHGSAWTFVAWGAWYAALLILEKLFLGRWLQKAPKILRHIYALLAILIGWIIFNSPSLGAGRQISARALLPRRGDGRGRAVLPADAAAVWLAAGGRAGALHPNRQAAAGTAGRQHGGPLGQARPAWRGLRAVAAGDDRLDDAGIHLRAVLGGTAMKLTKKLLCLGLSARAGARAAADGLWRTDQPHRAGLHRKTAPSRASRRFSAAALWTGDTAAQTEGFLKDHLYKRNAILKFGVWFQMRVLHLPVVEDVVLGSEVLLPVAEIADYRVGKLERRADAMAESLTAIQAATKDAGGQFCYVLVPEQRSALRDYYPDWMENRRRTV